MSMFGQCSECGHVKSKVFTVDGSQIRLCFGCIARQMREAIEPRVPETYIEELLRRLRPYR